MVLVARGPQSQLVYLQPLPRVAHQGTVKSGGWAIIYYLDTPNSLPVICGTLNGIDSSPDRRGAMSVKAILG